MLVSHAVAMTGKHMAIEISTSVRAFEGTASHEAFEGSIVDFNVFAFPPSQRPVQIKYWSRAQTYLYL